MQKTKKIHFLQRLRSFQKKKYKSKVCQEEDTSLPLHSFTQGVPANDTINMSFWRATIGSHRAKGNYKSQQKKRKVLPDSYSCHSPQPHFSLKNKGKACSSLPSNKKKKKKIFNLLLKAFSFPSLEAFHLHLCYHLLCKYVTHFNTSKY